MISRRCKNTRVWWATEAGCSALAATLRSSHRLCFLFGSPIHGVNSFTGGRV
jgi:hypothetical protein